MTNIIGAIIVLAVANAVIAKARGATGWLPYVPGVAIYQLIKDKFFTKK